MTNEGTSCNNHGIVPPLRGARARLSPAAPALPVRESVGTQSTLVPIKVAQFILGRSSDEIAEMVDCGSLRWVWNIAIETHTRRELRFLRSELLGDVIPTQSADAVQLAIDGHDRIRLRRREVAARWMISKQMVQRLAHAGLLKIAAEGRTSWVTTDSLRRFLTQRFIS